MLSSKAIQEKISQILFSKEFSARHRLEPRFFTRVRGLSFGIVMSLIIQKMTRSLAIEANILGILLKKEPVSKQALSQARYKIGVSAFQELHEQALKMHYTNNPSRKWKGFRVIGGDGSTLQLPKRGDIPLFFGEGFKCTCLARVMQFTELSSDIVLAAELMPYRTSETSMAKNLLSDLTKKMRSYGEENQIYVYDRGFPSHAFAQRHLDLGVHFLFRVQRQFGNEIADLVGKQVETSFNSTLKRGSINYESRVIIRYLDSGQPLVLVTSLLDADNFTDDEIIELYRMRWRCEESYKFQKTVLQLDGENCRTYQGVAQEFWATVLLATLMTFQFNEQEDKDKGIPQSKINRRVVFGSLKSSYLAALVGEGNFDEFNIRLEKLCHRHRVPIRPDRSYPRLSVDNRKTRHCYRRVT